MNWIAFAVAAWLAFGMEMGLRDALQVGSLGVAPSFVVILAVFIGVSASPRAAVTCGLLLGLLLDLTRVTALEGGADSVTIVGPHALGLMGASYAVVVMRTLVIRHNPLTLCFLTFLAMMIMEVIASAFLTIRAQYDPIAHQATRSLMIALGSALYSAAAALPMWLLLRPLTPLFGFPSGMASRRRIR